LHRRYIYEYGQRGERHRCLGHERYSSAFRVLGTVAQIRYPGVGNGIEETAAHRDEADNRQDTEYGSSGYQFRYAYRSRRIIKPNQPDLDDSRQDGPAQLTYAVRQFNLHGQSSHLLGSDHRFKVCQEKSWLKLDLLVVDGN